MSYIIKRLELKNTGIQIIKNSDIVSSGYSKIVSRETIQSRRNPGNCFT